MPKNPEEIPRDLFLALRDENDDDNGNRRDRPDDEGNEAELFKLSFVHRLIAARGERLFAMGALRHMVEHRLPAIGAGHGMLFKIRPFLSHGYLN